MDIQELFNTKAFVKGGVTFQTPQQYIEPFIERASKFTNNFNIETSGQVMNANEDQSINRAYSRVLIEPDFSDVVTEGMFKSIGFLYALDVGKPVIKIYVGSTVKACLNLCIFNADDVYTGNVLDGFEKAYSYADEYMNNMEKTFEDYLKIKNTMMNTIYTQDELHRIVGNLLHYSINNNYLGINAVVAGSKELFNPNSKYYVEDTTNAWNVYNSVTQNISSKSDLLDKSSKTLLLSKFFLAA